MAKELDDLKESRKQREQIIRKYGYVPTSVFEVKYRGKSVSEHEEGKREVIQTKKLQKKVGIGRVTAYKDNAFSASGKGIRGKQCGVSTFPVELALFILNFYSEKGDIVLDPCAGHNSRMEVTYKTERSYIGYDVSKEYIRFNESVKEKLLNERTLIKNPCTITLHAQSSEKMVEDSRSVDFCYTSPPYWDLEFYGDEPEQLGFGKSYEEFLNGMGRVIRECFRVLKKDKFCVFNVNDFRKGKFYDYHSDIARLFKESGFTLWDIVIVKWASCMGQIFASQIDKNKMTAKTHEYLIVGKK